MIVMQIGPYGLNSMVSTPGLREHFAFFLTDKDVANIASTCRVAHRNLLGDAIWKQRFIDLQIKLLQQSILSPQQTGFYARYSNAITYARGVDQSLKVARAVVDSVWFCPHFRSADMEEDEREVPVKFACIHAFLGAASIGMMIVTFTWDEIPLPARMLMWIPCMQGAGVILQTGYVYGKKFRVIQNIGGATSVMRKKAVIYKERTKGCLKNCRVTTCWQACSRGMRRLRNWMWSRHED